MDEIERQSTQPLFSDAFPPRADADLVLKSVDNIYFAVHKLLLALASPIFGDMFVVGNASQTEPVSLTEESVHLEALLKLVYPVENPSFEELSDLLQVYRAAYKYDIKSAFPILRTELITAKKRKSTILDFQTDLLSEDILYCYAFTRENNMEEVAALAQAAWLEGGTSSLRPKTKPNPVVDSMPYGWYRELWELREKRSNWLALQRWAIEDTIWQSEDEDDFKVVSLDEEDSRIWKL
ncbi:hypothetical protein ONZ45_g6844 [Pleurotus djamor]|nr:hypothetical protein ONZ45_g6844 [Pleurotus djamor]